VLALTDRVTVFRGGRVTGDMETRNTSAQDLANMMVGRKVMLEVEVPPQPELREPMLEVMGLTLRGTTRRYRLFDVNLAVRGGEIVGIAGVEGNGQSELLQALMHPNDPACRSAGLIRVLGQDVTEKSTAEVKALGVGVIPEDRHREGLLLDRPVSENFLLGLHRSKAFRRGGFLAYGALRDTASRALDEYDVRPRSLEVNARGLSGGNQQKLIIAREMERQPKLLIAAQPTRGVDVGAIEFIHRRILRARTEGAGVLLVSSELDEILALSDRILVMYEGSIIAAYHRGGCSERELGMRMGGARTEGTETGPMVKPGRATEWESGIHV
jgi:simple sugar transport system ATP-binding protein